MNLKHLTDKVLLQDTKQLAARERVLTAEILHHLKEIDVRKLYSDLKYSGLFEYCVKELSYTEASAQRRIIAARPIKEIPQIETKIESGALNLSNISKVVQFFKENNISKLSEKKEILAQVENLSARACEKKLVSMSNEQTELKIRISILEKTFNNLNEIRGLIGKRLNNDELFEVLIKNSFEKIERTKFKQNSKVTALPTSEAGRVISSGVKRKVYARDKKCVKCGSTHHLNYDHRIPYSLDGKSSATNVRLLCFNSNQRSRITASL